MSASLSGRTRCGDVLACAIADAGERHDWLRGGPCRGEALDVFELEQDRVGMVLDPARLLEPVRDERRQ